MYQFLISNVKPNDNGPYSLKYGRPLQLRGSKPSPSTPLHIISEKPPICLSQRSILPKTASPHSLSLQHLPFPINLSLALSKRPLRSLTLSSLAVLFVTLLSSTISSSILNSIIIPSSNLHPLLLLSQMIRHLNPVRRPKPAYGLSSAIAKYPLFSITPRSRTTAVYLITH